MERVEVARTSYVACGGHDIEMNVGPHHAPQRVKYITHQGVWPAT